MTKTVEIYTDGSCKVATRAKSGTCAIVVVDGQKVLYQQGYKYEDTTNNRMELMGCIQAMKWAQDNNTGRVYIHMDSQYVQLGITEWIHNWKQKNWRTAGKNDVANKDLWVELDVLKTKLPHVQFQWVRGHNSNKFNEMADKLCEESYSQLTEQQKEMDKILKEQLADARNRIQESSEAEKLLGDMYKMYKDGHGISSKTLTEVRDYLKQHKLI